MLKRHSLYLMACMFFLLSACGSRKFEKTPVDQLITQLDNEKTYSVILYDMDIEDHTFSETYRHKYKIITQKDSMPQERITDWQKVSEPFFARHQNDLGMELVSKTADGKVSKVTAPPGYSNYVGNPQYGHWNTGSNGTSFWEFYGQYAFMSSMLGLASSMINRNSYTDYRTNYWGRQPYYGTVSNGVPSYGTLSEHSKKMSPDFHHRATTNNSFKNKISDRVSRSNSGSSWLGKSNSSSSSSKSSGSSWFGRKSNSSSSSSSSRGGSSWGGRSSGRSRRR